MGELSGLQLRVLQSNPQVVDVLEKRIYRIGRAVASRQQSRPGYLVYSEPSLSSEHAELQWNEHERCFVLRHRSHTNFSVVGGFKLGPGQARAVKVGETIQLGLLELILEKAGKPVAVKRVRPKSSQSQSPWEKTIQQLRELNPKYRPPRVSAEDMTVFTRQFSAMIDAGIPIARALSFFGEGLSGGDLCKVVDGLAEKVNGGHRMSNAMRSYPQVFSDVYVSMVETGEDSGQLSSAMQRLADLLEKQLKMHKRVVATLTYPLILLLVSVICICVFIFFILPMIEPMFLGMKIPLPLPTRMLLASRHFMLPVIVVTLISAVAAWIFRPFVQAFLDDHPDLRSRVARAPMRWPIFGPVIRKIAVARILYSMATMLDSGMTLVHSITRSSSVTGNRWIEEQLILTKAAIIDGDTVASAFEVSEVFPQAAIQLITIGEETSSLATIVKYVADMYDEDADMALTDMANMLEPLLMGGMGIIVGFIVISAMLPTLELINHL